MHPTLTLPWLDVTLQSTRVALVLAIVTANLLAYRAMVRAGFDRHKVRWAMFCMAIIPIAGGRLHYVLANWERFADRSWLAIATPIGLHAPGAVIATVVGGLVVILTLRLPLGVFVDCLALPAGIGVAFARMGCFMHGCCFGTFSALPWAVTYPERSAAFQHHTSQGLLEAGALVSLPVHPLPVYFALAGLGITGLLLWMRNRRRFDGELALVFVVAFFGSSAVLELLRDDTFFRVYWGPLPQLLWLTGGVSLIGLLVLAMAYAVLGRRSTIKASPAQAG